MEHDEKVTLSDKINNFFEQNRKKVLIVFAGIFIAVIAVVVSFMIFENKKKSAMGKIETLILKFEKFKSDNLKNSSDSLTEEEKKKLAEAENALIEKLAAYSDNNNYAGFMACQQIADIYFRNNDFEKALTYYEKLNLPKDRYISGVMAYNAGTCADELGRNEKAIEFYKKAMDNTEFPFKARALFNVARVQENLDVKLAIDSYNKVLADYPDTEWASLSKTRIIELGLEH